MVLRYMLICNVNAGEVTKQEVYYLRTHGDAVQAKEFMLSISHAFGSWTSSVGMSRGHVLGLIDEMVKLGLWFEQEDEDYFIPNYTGVEICEYEPIEHSPLFV